MILIMGARLVRLSLIGLLSSFVLILAVGIFTGGWPSSLIWAALILFVMELIPEISRLPNLLRSVRLLIKVRASLLMLQFPLMLHRGSLKAFLRVCTSD